MKRGQIMPHLSNYLEGHVIEKIPQILKGTNVCLCEHCILDIAAITLNHLPAQYYVSEKGELFSKLNSLIQQYEIDIDSAILNAAAQVKKKPRHEMTGKKKNENIIIE